MDDCCSHSRLRCPACKLAMCMGCHSIHIHSDVKTIETKTNVGNSVRKEPPDQKKGKSPERKHTHSVFEPYWAVTRVEADLRAGRLKKGVLEVPESKKEQATFRGEDGVVVNIVGWEHRNRSLDGDTVAIQFHPNDGSKIVYNFTPIVGREFSGKLAMSVDVNNPMVAFSCTESKYPAFLTVLPASCVELLRMHMVRPTFKLKAIKWDATSKWPIGEPMSEDELEKAIREKTKNEKIKLKAAVGPSTTKKTFKPYATEEEMKAGLQSGELVQGILRIVSPKDAFVIARGLGVDIYLEGRKSRNRALDGDTVVVRINQKSEWKIITEEKRAASRRGVDSEEGKFDFPEEFHPARALAPDGTPLPQPTGAVVYILHRPIDPVKVGSLEVSTNPDKLALFKPLDLKAPFAVLPKRDWPKEFQNAQTSATKHFYVARFKEWKAEDAQPNCVLVGPAIGLPGTTEAETRVMLTECNINYDQNGEFSQDVLTEADNLLGAKLGAADFADRLDLRGKKMITIDSSDANDIESGFTLENNPDGTINVGIHVTDVSWFIKADSKIDQEARFRGCTVSLVHKTLPMFPRSISENLCSLIPGKDRLAFSVTFRLTKDGKLIPDEKPQFRRSVVRSCCKLDFKAAQLIVGHGPLEGNLPDELKEILLGPMQPVGAHPLEVVHHVQLLHELGIARRRTRFTTEGALSLQHVKLNFTLDAQQKPIGFEPRVHTPVHFAVEELKLLANRFVAEELADKAKDSALLIRQGPPDKARLDNVVHLLQSMGVGLQTGSAGQLQSSLNHFQNKNYRGGNVKAALEKLCLTPMQNPSYFCPGQIAIAKASADLNAVAFSKFTGVPVPEEKGIDERLERHHFSKNLDAYTHFTSPLRRYADLEVQRWLVWSFDPKQPSPHDLKEEMSIAEHCNFRYDWAKKAQELSSRIFLSIYLHHHQPLGWEEKALIVEIATHSFKVLVFRLGLEHRVNLSEVECIEAKITKEKILEIRHLDGSFEAKQVFDEVPLLLYGSIEPPCQIRFSLKPRQLINVLNPRGVPFSPRPVLVSPRAMMSPFTPRANFSPHAQPSPTHASNPSPRVGSRPRDLPATAENPGDKGPKSQKNGEGRGSQSKASNAKSLNAVDSGKTTPSNPSNGSLSSEAKQKAANPKPEAKPANKPKPGKGAKDLTETSESVAPRKSHSNETALSVGTDDKPRPRLSSTLSATSAVFTPASVVAPKVEKKSKRTSSGPTEAAPREEKADQGQKATKKREHTSKPSRKSETQSEKAKMDIVSELPSEKAQNLDKPILSAKNSTENLVEKKSENPKKAKELTEKEPTDTETLKNKPEKTLVENVETEKAPEVEGTAEKKPAKTGKPQNKNSELVENDARRHEAPTNGERSDGDEPATNLKAQGATEDDDQSISRPEPIKAQKKRKHRKKGQ